MNGKHLTSDCHIWAHRGVAAPGTLLALLGALVFLNACKHSDTADSEPVVTVQVATAQRVTLTHTITAEAIVAPHNQAVITPKISAPVSKFFVNRGDRVRQGQLLAVLENRDLAAAATENRGALEQAQAAYEGTTRADLPQQIQKAQLDAQAAKQTLDSQQQIYDSRQTLFKQGAIPRKELDQSSLDLTTARNNYEVAERHLNDLKAVGEQQQLRSAAAQVESAQGKYQGAQAQLAYSEIRSPITGVVTDRPVNQGEMASTSSPLMTIMDVSSVIGKAHIPQADAALLKTGDKATLSPAEGVEVPGKVTVVSPALDPNSTTVEVWVEAPNPNNTLRPGSTVKVTFNAGSIPNAIAIPAAAILTATDGSNSVVVVAHDPKRGDVAHPRPVTVGIKSGDLVQITQGLNAGDEVVTVGAFGLEDNTRLAVAQPGSASPASAPAAEKE